MTNCFKKGFSEKKRVFYLVAIIISVELQIPVEILNYKHVFQTVDY